MKQAQIISTDFIIGTILFITFLGVFVLVLINLVQPEISHEEELLNTHANLQANLPEEHQFYKNYRVNETALNNFKEEDYDFTELTLGNATTQGIGRPPEAHRSCLEITNATETLHSINNCVEIREDCTRTTTITKPALLDRGNHETNQLVNVHITVCQR